MSTLKGTNDIFRLSTLVKNVEVKCSATTELDQEYQILCLVLKNDDIFFRYTTKTGEVIVKKVKYFSEAQKRVQDICFDGSGTWLLVLCYDNTLHIVPAVFICDKSARFKLVFSAQEISSFVVPFCPPHECPNPQTCPNNLDSPNVSPMGNDLDRFSTIRTMLPTSGKNAGKTNEAIGPNSVYSQFYCESQLNTPSQHLDLLERSSDNQNNNNMETSTQSSLSVNHSKSSTGGDGGSTPMDSQLLSSSVSSYLCPYPTAVAWWKTINGHYRAIIGYSEGTICVVALTINCPFIGSTAVERGAVEKLVICRDNNAETITLMVNTSIKEQWKLLLEQKSIGYTFPGEFSPIPPKDSDELKNGANKDEAWQIVVDLKQADSPPPEMLNKPDCEEIPFEDVTAEGTSVEGKLDDNYLPKIIPAAKARLMSLRDLGARKIGHLKLKLAETRLKAKEREKTKDQAASLGLMEAPGIVPEILTTPAGPYFIVQELDGKHLLSALHSYSDTLSVHTMDISLIPIFLFKLPPNCRNLLLTKNLLYVVKNVNETAATPTNDAGAATSDVEMKQSSQSSIDVVEHVISSSQDVTNSSSFSLSNALGIVSCAMAVSKLGDECIFNDRALAALYRFDDEKIINIHRLMTPTEAESTVAGEEAAAVESGDSTTTDTLVSNYFNMKSELKKQVFSTNFTASDAAVLQNQFPPVNFERCCIVTDKNVYSIDLADHAHIIFLRFVDQANWQLCEEFCKLFNLSLPQCIEFAGDVLLKKKKVAQALLTYNIARIPPIKTALKLAMFSEVVALMHLCAMTLRTSYLLGSRYAMSPCIKYLMDTAHLRHIKYDTLLKVSSRLEIEVWDEF